VKPALQKYRTRRANRQGSWEVKGQRKLKEQDILPVPVIYFVVLETWT
jgi:hypothetical protein